MSKEEHEEFDTTLTANITCPYCGHEDTDSWERNESLRENNSDIECEECGETFFCELILTVDYSTKKKD